jgi:hypothetical protein
MVFVLPRPALQLLSRSFYRKAYPTYFAFVAVCALTIEYVYCPWVEGILSFKIALFKQHLLQRYFRQQLEPGTHAPTHPP